jgi:hypothetical protein
VYYLEKWLENDIKADFLSCGTGQKSGQGPIRLQLRHIRVNAFFAGVQKLRVS